MTNIKPIHFQPLGELELDRGLPLSCHAITMFHVQCMTVQHSKHGAVIASSLVWRLKSYNTMAVRGMRGKCFSIRLSTGLAHRAEVSRIKLPRVLRCISLIRKQHHLRGAPTLDPFLWF